MQIKLPQFDNYAINYLYIASLFQLAYITIKGFKQKSHIYIYT